MWRILIAIWIAVMLGQWWLGSSGPDAIPYSQFKQHLVEGRIAKVTVSERWVHGTLSSGPQFKAARVDDDPLIGELMAQDIEITGSVDKSGSPWLVWLVPLGLFALVFFLMRKQIGGGMPRAMTFGRSRAKLYVDKKVGVTFNDVAGVDEAKLELEEVIEFLTKPEKFKRLGGRLPRGVLLVGPPGTGKTLLARAVAGEAGVPFFSISGSEFVELFVGVGAARVRDLFKEAKAKAPCIIFIDELDALGKTRSAGPMAHEEREQTLNQLLVELDGFDSTAGVILMAATNRPEILDPALLRAGRFDRQVLVDRPDRVGRVAILEVHTRHVELDDAVDLDVVAGMTAGFAGADLANIVNEAALLAVRADKAAVGNEELSEAVERIIAGLEKKNRVLRQSEKERIAHHEVGHALVALAVPSGDPITKISIIPRGISALGYTLQLPTEDRFIVTRSELEDKIAMLLGGRAAEELVFGDVSTGAQDDLRKATDIARSMVEMYGMSAAIGKVSLTRNGPALLMPTLSERDGHSETTAREVDCEIRRLLDEQYDRAHGLLERRLALLRRAAAALLDKETITGDELNAMLPKTLGAAFAQ